MTTLTDTLATHGFHDLEGNSSQVFLQSHSLYFLTKPPVRTVMEIGFNAGHSSETFLQNPNVHVTSFDIGIRPYVTTAKQYIDTNYPLRHTLILGDSTQTVPKFIQENPTITFDVIYIDGGHEEEIVKDDMKNCLRLCHPGTIIIMDDVVYEKTWEAIYTIGPTKVWSDHVKKGYIQELAHVEYCPGRGMSWGIPLGSNAQSEEAIATSTAPIM
jgi:predicted O-methyltransferase YrrM